MLLNNCTTTVGYYIVSSVLIFVQAGEHAASRANTEAPARGVLIVRPYNIKCMHQRHPASEPNLDFLNDTFFNNLTPQLTFAEALPT